MKRSLSHFLIALFILAGSFVTSAQQASSALVRSYVKSDYTYHLFWDTKTGTSQLYSWDSDLSKYTAAEIGLPATPLQNLMGGVRVNSYVRSEITYHLFYDIKTGSSQLYSWDPDVSNYTAAEVGLPATPLQNLQGDVSVNSYVKSEKTYHLFWDTKTGTSQLYSWDSDISNYSAAKVGLPATPLQNLQGEVRVNSYVRSDVTYHLFWDSKTGTSQLYSWDADLYNYSAAEIGLPATPLQNIQGDVRVNSYVKSEKTYHLFYDTKTGASQLYSWDADLYKYTAAEIGLPSTPLQNVQGEVRVNSYVKGDYTYHLFWDTKTGNSQLYSWDSDLSKYTAAEIGLPNTPLITK